jgi:hypothetical protein
MTPLTRFPLYAGVTIAMLIAFADAAARWVLGPWSERWHMRAVNKAASRREHPHPRKTPPRAPTRL